ncbi:MAG: hypothetical protein GY842_09035 [bacterium]|nr:hypothetical protein [bacterium]
MGSFEVSGVADRSGPVAEGPVCAERNRWGRWIPLVLLGIGLALRLGIAWQDHRFLLSEYVWSDDAYLSLSVARNLALGNGMTSDGTQVTNGFQPLYVFLLVPVFALVSADNLVLPIHLAGTILALAGTAAAGIYYLLARRLFSRSAALCVLFFFAVSHYFVVTDVNGLETALYGLTLAATLYYYVTRFVLVNAGEPPDVVPGSARRNAALGVLSGLMVLARVDGVIFLVSMVAHFLFQRRKRFRPAVRSAVVGAGAFLVTLSPWWIANLVLCGTIIPDSGPAVRHLAMENGWRPVSKLVGLEGPEDFIDGRVPARFYANNVLHYVAQTVAFVPLTAHAQGMSDNSSLPRSVKNYPIGRWMIAAPWVWFGGVVVLTLAVLFGTVPLLLRSKATSGIGAIAFVRFAVAGWIGVYALYVLCPWYSYRYVYPAVALLTLASGGLAQALFERVLGRRVLARRAVLALGAVLYGFLFVTHTSHYYVKQRSSLMPDRYWPVVPWVEAHIPRDARIGAFQSGVLSYFLPHECVNLDGVVNARALEAMRAYRLWEYIRSQGVDYIVDWPVCIDGLLTKFAGVEYLPLEPIYTAASMDVYRIVDAP